jgi:hypothetical protein
MVTLPFKTAEFAVSVDRRDRAACVRAAHASHGGWTSLAIPREVEVYSLVHSEKLYVFTVVADKNTDVGGGNIAPSEPKSHSDFGGILGQKF